MLKIITILPMILWVSACTRIKPKPNCDLSFQFDRCRCRCYDYNAFGSLEDKKCNKKKLAKSDIPELFDYDEEKEIFLFRSGDYTVGTCEGISGAYLHDLAREILPKAKKNLQACEDLE